MGIKIRTEKGGYGEYEEYEGSGEANDFLTGDDFVVRVYCNRCVLRILGVLL